MSDLPVDMLVAFAIVLGAIHGSFLNVVIARAATRSSVIWPASRCPNCSSPIRARHNVPVFGWLLLRGRCRDCTHPISRQYPTVEALTGVLFGGATLILHDDPAALGCALAAILLGVCVSVVDEQLLIVPLPITLAGLAAAAAAIATNADLPSRLTVSAALVVFFGLLWFFRDSIGMADIGLIGIGALLAGPLAVWLLLGSAGLVAVHTAATRVAQHRRGLEIAAAQTLVPYGPAITVAAAALSLLG